MLSKVTAYRSPLETIMAFGLLASVAAFSASAHAGECPADQVMKGAVTSGETKPVGVTDVVPEPVVKVVLSWDQPEPPGVQTDTSVVPVPLAQVPQRLEPADAGESPRVALAGAPVLRGQGLLEGGEGAVQAEVGEVAGQHREPRLPPHQRSLADELRHLQPHVDGGLGVQPAGWETVAADWASIADVDAFERISEIREKKRAVKAAKSQAQNPEARTATSASTATRGTCRTAPP